MSDPSLDDLARRLEELPREAWERPVPPPAPWPAPRHEPRRAGWRLQLRPLAAAAAAVALLAAGATGGLLISDDPDAGDPAGSFQRVELEPLDGKGRGATGTARLNTEPGGRTSVQFSGLGRSSGKDFYELWLLGDDGKLVSLGSFRVPASGKAKLEATVPVDPARFRFLDVSREPADGDPGHSADSVLRGPIA